MDPDPTKLTLRIDRTLIKKAKRYARQRGTSISRLVAEYFRAISLPEKETSESRDEWKNDLHPITKRLVSRHPRTSVSDEDYYRYLEEKHK